MPSMSTRTDGFVPQVGRSVSIEQAAHLLGISRRTVYNRIKEGRLHTVRTLGGSQRVLMVSLQQFAPRSDSPWSDETPTF